MGQTGHELHVHINQHKSNTIKKENPTFEIIHFRLYSFVKIQIEILDHVENQSDRLARENDFLLKFKFIYPYGLNTMLNHVDIKNIVNVYNLYDKFNNMIAVNRG